MASAGPAGRVPAGGAATRLGVARVALGLIVASGVACADQKLGPETVTSDGILDEALLTPELRAQLTAEGRFRIAAREVAGEIDVVSAGRLARLWIRDHAPMVLGYLEDTHGAPIDVTALSQCGDPLYSRSAYDVSTAASPIERRAYGSWWLVSFCSSGGRRQVSLAVSAGNTHLKVEDDQLLFPTDHGAEFVWTGIPLATGDLETAEGAAMFAARQTGRRIAGVPELMAPAFPHIPQLAVWRVPLERPVAIRARNDVEPREATEIFVGWNVEQRRVDMHLPVREQPGVQEVPRLALGVLGKLAGRPTMLRLSAVPGRTLRFEPVTSTPR